MLVILLAFVIPGALVYGQDVSTTHAPHHHPHRVVCYTAGWASNRPDPVQFHPEDIDTSLCTHLLYAFALPDKTGLNMIPADATRDPEMYQRLISLKREKPSLKVMLSLGGWTAGSHQFTLTVSSVANMHAFALNVIAYLHRYGFDGLDLDWEYPAARGSPPADKQRFTQLLKIVKQEFNHDHSVTKRNRLLLSIAIGAAPYRINASYEMPDIANYTDFINVMTYDLHGSWDTTTGHHSPLYSPSNDQTDSVDYMMNWLLKTTVPREKLNLGLTFYGASFNLSDPNNKGLGAPVTGPGAGGQYLHSKGVLAFYEVCKLLTEHNDTITASGRLPGTQAPYLVDGSRWTGYDDAQSIKEKVGYAMQNGLGGVFIWTVDMDDFHGICGGGHYPLMNAIKEQYHQGIIGR